MGARWLDGVPIRAPRGGAKHRGPQPPAVGSALPRSPQRGRRGREGRGGEPTDTDGTQSHPQADRGDSAAGGSTRAKKTPGGEKPPAAVRRHAPGGGADRARSPKGRARGGTGDPGKEPGPARRGARATTPAGSPQTPEGGAKGLPGGCPPRSALARTRGAAFKPGGWPGARCRLGRYAPDRHRDSGRRARRATADPPRGRGPGASGDAVCAKRGPDQPPKAARDPAAHFLLGMGRAHPGRDAPDAIAEWGKGPDPDPSCGRSIVSLAGIGAPPRHAPKQSEQRERHIASGASTVPMGDDVAPAYAVCNTGGPQPP